MLTLGNAKSLTRLYRCLNNHTRRNFGVYTNETLKKTFDEKLKEKYFTKDQKEYLNPEEEQNQKLFEEMKETYEDVYKDLQNEGKSSFFSHIFLLRFHLLIIQRVY